MIRDSMVAVSVRLAQRDTPIFLSTCYSGRGWSGLVHSTRSCIGVGFCAWGINFTTLNARVVSRERCAQRQRGKPLGNTNASGEERERERKRGLSCLHGGITRGIQTK